MRRKKVIPQSLRLSVIERDNRRCRACGIGDVDALQCDHIVPESRGGKTSLDNLQALCGVCNNRKGNTDIGSLPAREPIDGFGDYAEVMRERSVFLEKLAEVRQHETVRLRAMVQTWREAQVQGFVIRRRLEKMVGSQKVEGLLR